jgi:hypothetical protein
MRDGKTGSDVLKAALAPMATDAKARNAVPCPFVYASGKRCGGQIVRVEAYKADLFWVAVGPMGEWRMRTGQPRSHYHLFCSEKGNHAGAIGPDSSQLKLYFDQLPEKLQKIISRGTS